MNIYEIVFKYSCNIVTAAGRLTKVFIINMKKINLQGFAVVFLA